MPFSKSKETLKIKNSKKILKSEGNVFPLSHSIQNLFSTVTKHNSAIKVGWCQLIFFFIIIRNFHD